MKPAFGQRLDAFARNSSPVLFALVLVLLNVVPLHIPGFSRIVPVLPLMAIYHWAVYRPELMPPLAVFFVGVIYDILSGTPLGVNALVFLTIYGVVVFQRRFFIGRSFVIVWLGFGIMAFVAAVEAWILVSILLESIVEPRALVFQYILNVGFFPMLAWLFLRWQQRCLRSEQAGR